MARSGRAGRRRSREAGAEPVIGGDEPLADWERELLTGGDAAAAPAAEAAAGRRGRSAAEAAAGDRRAPAAAAAE